MGCIFALVQTTVIKLFVEATLSRLPRTTQYWLMYFVSEFEKLSDICGQQQGGALLLFTCDILLSQCLLHISKHRRQAGLICLRSPSIFKIACSGVNMHLFFFI